jgi:hypothetical protein
MRTQRVLSFLASRQREQGQNPPASTREQLVATPRRKDQVAAWILSFKARPELRPYLLPSGPYIAPQLELTAPLYQAPERTPAPTGKSGWTLKLTGLSRQARPESTGGRTHSLPTTMMRSLWECSSGDQHQAQRRLSGLTFQRTQDATIPCDNRSLSLWLRTTSRAHSVEPLAYGPSCLRRKYHHLSLCTTCPIPRMLKKSPIILVWVPRQCLPELQAIRCSHLFARGPLTCVHSQSLRLLTRMAPNHRSECGLENNLDGILLDARSRMGSPTKFDPCGASVIRVR